MLFSNIKILFLSILLLFPAAGFAQEVLVKQAERHTELFLKVPVNNISSVSESGSSITVTFSKTMKQPFTKPLQDKYIESVKGSGNTFIITFYPSADYAAFRDPEGIKFVGANPKEVDNILLSYGLGAPTLRKASKFAEDPAAAAMIKQAEQLASQNLHRDAASMLNNLIAEVKSPYYKQEALFSMGNILMDLGKYDSSAYMEAAEAMDELIKLYPDSSRISQAYRISAEAKEKLGLLNDATSTYYQIFNTSLDAQTRRDALERIGALYTNVGQFDKALDAYDLYLDNFKTDSQRIQVLAGSLYLRLGYRDKAYNLFKDKDVNDIISTLPKDQLLVMADIFSDNGEKRKAFTMLESITKDANNDFSDPKSIAEDPFFGEAMYRIANIYKDFGDDEHYIKTLLDLAELSPNSYYGNLAITEFAEQNYKDRSAGEWREFLKPVYDGYAGTDLIPRADLVLIKAMQNDNSTEDMINAIDVYVAGFPSAPESKELSKLKEDTVFQMALNYQNDKNYPLALETYDKFLEEFDNSTKAPAARQYKEDIVFQMASDYQNDKNYPLALETYNKFLSEFDNSTRVPAVRQYIDDIYFTQAKEKYDSGDDKAAMDMIQTRMIELASLLPHRWIDLWEDVTFRQISNSVDNIDPQVLRYKAREYLSQSSEGKYANKVKDILVEAFQYPYYQALNRGDYSTVISLYNENKPWLDNWHDQSFNNRTKIAAATALLEIDARDDAKKLFREVTPSMSADYAILGYSLCENVIFDLNGLEPEQFNMVMDLAEGCGIDYAMNLAQKYTKDPKASLKAQYELSKIISNDRSRERVISQLYNQLLNNTSIRFDGFEDVFLDEGTIAFKKNNFAGAVIPLQRYVDLISEDTDKKAEALYYLGKSLISMNQREQGFEYYRRLSNMPDSVYKNLAKSELEDYAWRNNLNSGN